MDQKQRLFIYDRKEMGVLVLLAVMVAVFAFTLGVHLGKKVGPRGTGLTAPSSTPVATAPDEVPNRQELQEQSKGVNQAADDSLSQTLHDEVGRTGMKLDSPRQTELPNRAAGAGMPTAAAPDAEESRLQQRVAKEGTDDEGETPHAAAPAPRRTVKAPRFFGDLNEIPAAKRAAAEGQFTLQVGSFSNLEEAKNKVDSMEALGLQPLLRAVDIKGKGKWYRIFIGGYPSKDDAERAGARFRSEHVIDSYIISKNVG